MRLNTFLVGKYNRLINTLSFSSGALKLRQRINLSIDVPETIEEFPDSHPRGFIKEFRKRRTTIVETYLRITKVLDSDKYSQRIQALHLLAEHILYARSLKMPLNAARVQLAIMKEVVKRRDDKRSQLELMRDFTISSFGHPRAIKHYLKKFHIIEVPETGEPLKDLRMGWDYHVHDNTSYGIKSPTQLIIDAFIKGISELTVAYNTLDYEEAIKEVLEAGKILGIKVNIALEFSAMTNGLRFQYMYILPGFSSNKKKFKKFLRNKTEDFKEFLHELEQNEKKRSKTIRNLVDRFNMEHLPAINQGYQPDSIYYLEPLSLSSDSSKSQHRIYSRRQLGEFLYPRIKTIYEKRALRMIALKRKAVKFPDQFSKDEKMNILREYQQTRDTYRELDPEGLRMKYFSLNDPEYAQSAVSNLDEIHKLSRKSGGKIKWIKPLEHGFESAVDFILENYKYLDIIEIYNMYDTIETDESAFSDFSNFLELFLHASPEQLTANLEARGIGFDRDPLMKAMHYFRSNNILLSLGSDAAGRSTFRPGMGFIFKHNLLKGNGRVFKKQHQVLPDEVSGMIYKHGKVQQVRLKRKEKPTIICLGREVGPAQNLLGDEFKAKPIGFKRAWEYLNPSIKNLLFILVGFVPAYLILGPAYALLWFAITGFRNVFVDLISSNGYNPTDWRNNDINWSNLAQSLLWTGFSVPILGFVKAKFDVLYPLDHQGTMYEFAKFFFINVANGTYLATHNYIRGFDKATIRGNFFRSILAWPLSVAFAPIGNFLEVPSIVQAKFWSDFVASIIEGTGKYKTIIRIKDKIMRTVVPDTLSEDEDVENMALLDLIYFTHESNRAKVSVLNILSDRERKGRFIRRNRRVLKEKGPYRELLSRFEDPVKFDVLLEFVIRNYNKEQSLYLLQLVSDHFYELRKWLQKLRG